MKKIKPDLIFCGILLLTFFGFVCKTYCQSQRPIALEYNFPADGIKYLTTSKIIQTMDIQGQSMQANVYSALGCTIKQTGRQDGNLKLEVKIDTLGQQSDTPQGFTGGAIAAAIGKTFNMILTPLGKEKDVSEAAGITYFIEGSGQTDLSQSFSSFFPDLPEKAISPGYNWNTADTMNARSQTMTMVMIIKAENRFEGFEAVGGTECAKIVSALSGTRDMKIQTQGMDIRMAGPFTGTSTLLFDHAGGYFLKQTVITRLDGSLELSSEGMTIPLIMDMTSANEVVK